MRPSRTHYALVSAALALSCGGTEPSNAPPVASFTATCEGLECVFENGSTDQDGAIAKYAWVFGDGGTSSEPSPTHTFDAPGGEFTVTVTVTDDANTSASASRQVVVSDGNANRSPLAAFSATCTGLTCSFTNLSNDPDADDQLVSSAWSFGDGLSSSETSPVHGYAEPGQFNVTLLVADNHGATGDITVAVLATTGIDPGRSGTYERRSPHQSPGLQSRFVIREDGTFDYLEENATSSRQMGGTWRPAATDDGWGLEADGVILLDFADFNGPVPCYAEAIGTFLLDGLLGISYCWEPIQFGLEEGLYGNSSSTDSSNDPPPVAGQVAFVRDGKIHLANTDGTGLVQLTSGTDADFPAWSPDGARIAFSNSGAAPGLYVMAADGTNPVRLTNGGWDPTWSPDGQWIAFSCGYYVDAICKMKTDEAGAVPDTLVAGPKFIRYPDWSPDGTRIAYTSDRSWWDFFFDTWTVAPDGSSQALIRQRNAAMPSSDDHYQHYQPAWSPDGQRIAFVGCPWAFSFCSSSAIVVMDADGSNVVRVAAATGFSSPTWSPDGQIIAYSSAGSIEWLSADGSQRGRIVANGHSPAWRPRQE